MRRTQHLVSIAFAFATTLFCAAAFATLPDYVQPPTGFKFPADVGGFSRTKITPYTGSHSDVEVDYDNNPFTVHLSVYVYPATGPLKAHYDQCRAEVNKIHADAKLLEEKPFTLEKSGVNYAGYYALFGFRDKFVNDKRQDLLSQLILFRRDDNYILYRISYAESDKDAAQRQIDDFLKQFVWPPGGRDAFADPK